MADRIVQLIDENDNNIFPVASVANAANITMTDTDPGEGSALEAGNYVAVYGQNGFIENADIANGAITAEKTEFGGNYSLTEQDTGFTWIDGKHIYKKTIDIGALPNSTNKDVLHNISNLGYVIEIKGTAYEQNTTNSIILPYVGDNANAGVKMYVTSTKINIWAGTNRSSYSGYVTLYYTKS